MLKISRVCLLPLFLFISVSLFSQVQSDEVNAPESDDSLSQTPEAGEAQGTDLERESANPEADTEGDPVDIEGIPGGDKEATVPGEKALDPPEGLEPVAGGGDTDDEEVQLPGFDEDKEIDSRFILMIEPLTARFGFNPILSTPHPSNSAAVVPDAVYFGEQKNQSFGLDYEYAFEIGGHFVAFPWMTVGLGIGFSYEQTPFVAHLPAEGDASEKPTLYPTYYSVGISNGKPITDPEYYEFARIMQQDFGDDGSGQPLFDGAGLPYGLIRAELTPSVQFFPLRNASADIKGLFIGVSPVLGIQLDTPTKTYMDILYENGLMDSVLGVEGSSYYGLIKSVIHDEKNWETIQKHFNPDGAGGDGGPDLGRFVNFYGGIRLDIGWQGVLSRGAVLKASTGVAYDSSRGFYYQVKTSVGYLMQ